MLGGRTLSVVLTADLKNFTQGMNEAETRTASFGGSLNNMLGPAMIAAGVAAAGLAVKLGVDGVKAAMEEEAAIARLTQTLANMGLESAIGGVEAFIDSTQRATGVADDELRPAFDRLVRSTGDVGEAQRALRIAMDVSAGTGRSLDQVVQALGKAYDGNAAGLSRLGAGISKATLKTGDMRAITQELADMFGGQATVKAATFQGQIDRLGVAAGELQEAFGIGLLGALQDTNGQTEAVMGTMQNLEPVVENLGQKLGEAALNAGYLTTAFTTLASQVENNQEEELIWGHLLEWVNTSIMPDAIENLILYGKAQAAASARQAQAQAKAKALADEYGAGYRALAEYRRQTGGAIPITAAMTEETDNLSRALAQLEGRARSAASAWASAYGPVLTALLNVGAIDEFYARVTKLDLDAAPPLKNVANNLSSVGSSAGAAASETDDAARLIDDAYDSIYQSAEQSLNKLVDELGNATDALDDAKAKVKAFSDEVAADLLKAFDPGAAYKAALNDQGEVDVQGWLGGVQKGLEKLDWFGNVLTEIRRSGGPGGEALASYLQQQGVELGGAMGQKLIDEGLVEHMANNFMVAERAAKDFGDAMVPPMLTTGVQMAQTAVENLGLEVLASRDKLVAIGEAIGKPVGAGFAKEISDAVADALEKAERTRSAAQARQQATAANRAVADVTEQQAVQAFQRAVNNANARAGLINNPFGIVLG